MNFMQNSPKAFNFFTPPLPYSSPGFIAATVHVHYQTKVVMKISTSNYNTSIYNYLYLHHVITCEEIIHMKSWRHG